MSFKSVFHKHLLSALFCMLSLAYPYQAAADGDYCPEKIGTIQGDPLAVPATEILRKVYKDLGCNLKAVPLPGARGILHFNKRLVDGELYRLRLAEDHYERDFVRSLVPLIVLTNAVWENPDYTISTTKPFGYVRGIKWHEDYVKRNLLDLQNLAQFNTEEKMFEAFARGAIGRFLSETQTIRIMEKDQRMPIGARQVEVIEKKPLFHYLSAKYAVFMADFSKYVEERQSFKMLE